jgi:hypothetical protein
MLVPGDVMRLFNAETLAGLPLQSIAIAIGPNPGGGYSPIAFDIEFAATPVTASVIIQGAMTDTPAAYQTLYTSTNKQQDYYGDVGKFRFYTITLVSQSAGGAITVTVSR